MSSNVCFPPTAIPSRLSKLALATGISLLFVHPSHLNGQVFVDPGFESYTVNEGAFLQPSTGPWIFSNDAGVVDPPAPNSSTGPLNTWSATFPAFEGEQYVSTYAALDNLQQEISFATPGDYLISVHAAAPEGSVAIPPLAELTLETGGFTFILDNGAIGGTHSLIPGTDWTLYTAGFAIEFAGEYSLGVRNAVQAPYFINYDAFAITSVPEPAFWRMILLAAGVILVWRGRSHR